MARPTKQGIDYFPVDCQFDDKLELLIVDKGGIALAVIITIWQLIYQNNGYYVENGHDLALLIKRRIMVDAGIIEDVIKAAVDRDIFNKGLYKKHKILTGTIRKTLLKILNAKNKRLRKKDRKQKVSRDSIRSLQWQKKIFISQRR